MSELIDKQAAVDIAKELTITVKGYEMHNQAVMNYCAEIMQLPSVQPERPKGEWIHQVKFSRIECDQCGKVFRNSFAPKNFCPNCGADMRTAERNSNV